MKSQRKYDGLEIAVIGMSLNFPQSHDYRQFWNNLTEGREMIKTFTEEELKQFGVVESTLYNRNYIRSEGVMDNKDCFDNVFFGYSKEEASVMDPQIRVFHEHCWKALEDAGYAADLERLKVGLFAGASENNNWKIYVYSRSSAVSIDPYYLNKLAAHIYINTLISYKLNLRGPSIYVDTACSTSLSAIHLACRSLLMRECSIALAGGVCVNTGKGKGYFFQEGMIASADGKCRAFDAQASGAVGGEGVGVVVLKRLSDAMKDRDHIYAVVKASFVNNDGSQKVGYTAPSVKGQSECISNALKMANIPVETIHYIETHGTGTKLGDPIEIRALNEAFGTGGKEKFCAIGSVKSNMGHLDAAAGVAGFIKTALSLYHKQIPASLHFVRANPDINFDEGPFYVNTSLRQWNNDDDAPLRAGVSSLGIGGSNAHAILEEAPAVRQGDAGRSVRIFILSARSADALIRNLGQHKSFLLHNSHIDLSDMAFTLQVGRKALPYRLAISFREREDLIEGMQRLDIKAASCSPAPRRVPVFMFPGQGSQYTGMGKGIYDSEPVFREIMDSGFAIIERATGMSFKGVLYPPIEGDNRIDDTQFTQPLIFLLEYAFARYMISIGVAPQYMIGHSIGEYVAACISGVFSFEDALQLVLKRGKLIAGLPSGDMLSVAIPEDIARGYLDDGVSLAAINGHEQVVFSGKKDAVEKLLDRLEKRNIPYIRLRTSHAFHSEMLDPILEEFRAAVEMTNRHPAAIPIISNLTGRPVKDEEIMSSSYWVRHMREPVRFQDGIDYILNQNKEWFFIEAGAGHTLTNFVKQRTTNRKIPPVLNMLRSIKETEEDMGYLASRLGQLWTRGIGIDWDKYYAGEKRNRVSLPTYSFECTRYPAEVDPFADGWANTATGKAVPKELKDCLYHPGWKRKVLGKDAFRTGGRRCILFSSGSEFSRLLKDELSARGADPVEVFVGQDVDRVLTGETGKEQVEIIYTWGMCAKGEEMTLDMTDAQLQLLYIQFVKIIQALAGTKELKVSVLTDRLHRVAGNEQVAHRQALLLGLINVLAQECSCICRNIDIDGDDLPGSIAAISADELVAAADDRIVALRGGYRWVPDYQRNERPIVWQQSRLRPQGVYLITGGLGNLGFVLSKYLLQKHQARLVVTGRDQLGTGKEGQLRKERFELLKGMGGEIMYAAADAADIAALEKAVTDAEKRFGPVHGVIHLAGVIDNEFFQLIEEMDIEKSFELLSPKIKGIENIYHLFKDRRPDFTWVASSISSVLGGLGFGAYASANLYMEHLIQARQKELPGWKCIGLGGLSYSEGQLMTDALNPSEIISLFEWSLASSGDPVLLEYKGDLEAKLHEVYNARIEEHAPALHEEDKYVKAARPELSTQYQAATTPTEEKVVRLFENFFDMEGVGVMDDFFELGGDSLKGMMFVKRIKRDLGVQFNLHDFFAGPTSRKIAARIDEHMWLSSTLEMENEITI